MYNDGIYACSPTAGRYYASGSIYCRKNSHILANTSNSTFLLILASIDLPIWCKLCPEWWGELGVKLDMILGLNTDLSSPTLRRETVFLHQKLGFLLIFSALNIWNDDYSTALVLGLAGEEWGNIWLAHGVHVSRVWRFTRVKYFEHREKYLKPYSTNTKVIYICSL